MKIWIFYHPTQIWHFGAENRPLGKGDEPNLETIIFGGYMVQTGSVSRLLMKKQTESVDVSYTSMSKQKTMSKKTNECPLCSFLTNFWLVSPVVFFVVKNCRTPVWWKRKTKRCIWNLRENGLVWEFHRVSTSSFRCVKMCKIQRAHCFRLCGTLAKNWIFGF